MFWIGFASGLLAAAAFAAVIVWLFSTNPPGPSF